MIADILDSKLELARSMGDFVTINSKVDILKTGDIDDHFITINSKITMITTT